jgi:hypothetical protein
MYPAGRGFVGMVCNRCGGFLLGEVELRPLDYTHGQLRSPGSQRGVSHDSSPKAWPFSVAGGYLAALRLSVRQRMPASMKSSIAPSNTADVLPTSCSVRRSLTIWYGFRT